MKDEIIRKKKEEEDSRRSDKKQKEEGMERTRQRTQSLPPRVRMNRRATFSEKDVAR